MDDSTPPAARSKPVTHASNLRGGTACSAVAGKRDVVRTTLNPDLVDCPPCKERLASAHVEIVQRVGDDVVSVKFSGPIDSSPHFLEASAVLVDDPMPTLHRHEIAASPQSSCLSCALVLDAIPAAYLLEGDTPVIAVGHMLRALDGWRMAMLGACYLIATKLGIAAPDLKLVTAEAMTEDFGDLVGQLLDCQVRHPGMLVVDSTLQSSMLDVVIRHGESDTGSPSFTVRDDLLEHAGAAIAARVQQLVDDLVVARYNVGDEEPF